MVCVGFANAATRVPRAPPDRARVAVAPQAAICERLENPRGHAISERDHGLRHAIG
jgi:hypothetical protein